MSVRSIPVSFAVSHAWTMFTARPEKNRYRESDDSAKATHQGPFAQTADVDLTCALAVAIWLSGVRKRTLMATVRRHPTQTNQGHAIFGHQSGMNQPKFQSACLNSPRKSAPTSNAGSATLHRISTDVMPTIIAITFAPSRPRVRVSIPRRKTASNAPYV